MSAEVAWGGDRRAVVRTADELDALLDRLVDEARRTGRPQEVELTVDRGSGALGVVIGGDRSVLNHVPADGNPPYLSSLGEEGDERTFTYGVGDDHHTEVPWRHTVPMADARAAARTFLTSGRLDPRVRWGEG